MEELKSHAYEAIILDIRMPGRDGLEALTQIKKLFPDPEVIMLTGHASVDLALKINIRGGYDYLLKPCPLEEILLKIDAAFERKKVRGKRGLEGGL